MPPLRATRLCSSLQETRVAYGIAWDSFSDERTIAGSLQHPSILPLSANWAFPATTGTDESSAGRYRWDYGVADRQSYSNFVRIDVSKPPNNSQEPPLNLGAESGKRKRSMGSRLKAQLRKFCTGLCGGLSRPLGKFVAQRLFGIQAGRNVKLRILCEKLPIISQRFFGIPPFRFYALADGIRRVLSASAFQPPQESPPDAQLQLALIWSA